MQQRIKRTWAWIMRLIPEWTSKILAVVIGLSLGLLLIEGCLRWLVPGSTQYYVHPPNLVKRFRPEPGTMPGVEGISHFTTNSMGLRGEQLDQGNGWEYRILALGGSTTECLYLDDTESWPFLVQELLERAADGREVQVGNAGKAGANSRDHVVQAKYLLRQLPRIDLVLVLVGINDFSVALAQGDEYVLPPPLSNAEVEAIQLRHAFSRVPGRLPYTAVGLYDQGAVAWYQKTASYVALMEARLRGGWMLYTLGPRAFRGGWEYAPLRKKRYVAPKIDELPDLTSGLVDYARNLDAIIDLAQANGSRIVLMTQPVLWRDDLDPEEEKLIWFGGQGNFLEESGHPYYSTRVLVEGMAVYNQELLRVCEARRVSCIDLASKVPRTTEYFYDDAHFTERGAQLVSRIVSEELIRLDPALGSRARRRMVPGQFP